MAALFNPKPRKGIRESVAVVPEQLLSPPYALRSEMDWFDFSSIANPLGTPPTLIETMQRMLVSGTLSYTPDREAHALRSVLARRFKLPVESFLVGASVSDLIRAVAQTYEPCAVGISVPSRTEYALATGNAGHEIVEITSPVGFIVPDPASAFAHAAHFEAAILANPSYPTSRLLQKGTLRRYLEECRWVIVDERSIELTLGGESMASLTREHKNLIVIRSFSESFAMAGAPVSYCIAHPETIAEIGQFYDASGISMFAEIIGEVALEEENMHLERAREFLDSEIPWLQCMLSLLPGIDIFPAEANYVMCSYVKHEGMGLKVANVEELNRQLQLKGFLIRKLEDMNGLPSTKYFCVSVRRREENEKLIAALREVICGQ